MKWSTTLKTAVYGHPQNLLMHLTSKLFHNKKQRKLSLKPSETNTACVRLNKVSCARLCDQATSWCMVVLALVRPRSSGWLQNSTMLRSLELRPLDTLKLDITEMTSPILLWTYSKRVRILELLYLLTSASDIFKESQFNKKLTR